MRRTMTKDKNESNCCANYLSLAQELRDRDRDVDSAALASVCPVLSPSSSACVLPLKTPWKNQEDKNGEKGSDSSSSKSIDHYQSKDHQLARPALPLFVDYFKEATTYQNLEQEVKRLEHELQIQGERLAQKDMLIQTLQSAKTNPDYHTASLDSTEHTSSLAGDSLDVSPDDEEYDTNLATSNVNGTPAKFGSFSVEAALEAFSSWLFRAASRNENLPVFLGEYATFLLEMGVPVHRMNVIASVMPVAIKSSTYHTWTWSEGQSSHCIMTPSEEDTEPLIQFWRDDQRLRSSIRSCGYMAMPLRHNCACKGAIAWATETDFSEAHIRFMQESHVTLATVLRTYLNDVCVEHLVEHLDDEIAERTRKLEETNQRLNHANQRIKQQSGQQLKHFAMMSHEIRTPLNGMIGLTSLLQSQAEDLTLEQAETVDMIANSGDLLLGVVNDVLDYSKLTLGMVEISKETTQLFPLFQQVLDASRIKAQQRQINIQTFFASDLPFSIYTDGRRLQQIVFNLLGNAIKFGKEGSSVELKIIKSVAMAGDQHACPRLRIMIKDYGKGIEKSHFTKIFEPFQQADTETERTYGGTGLGLAITSRLVKSLGGTIKVDSEVGKWCVFTVELELEGEDPESCDDESEVSKKGDGQEVIPPSSSPLQFGQSSDLDALGTANKSPFCHKRIASTSGQIINDDRLDSFRILVAEDNRINQTLLQLTLGRLGVKNVEMVDDGSSAVQRCNENRFDLILMDMQMPNMDGIQATRLIRQQCTNSNAGTKIIFVTAHALRDYEARALEVGADGFLSKPYKIGNIKDIIESVLSETK